MKEYNTNENINETLEDTTLEEIIVPEEEVKELFDESSEELKEEIASEDTLEELNENLESEDANLPTSESKKDLSRELTHLLREAGRFLHPGPKEKVSQKEVLLLLTKDEEHTQKSLGEKLHRSPAAISEIIRKLENAGLIKRVINKNDRRVFDLELTSLGKEKAEEYEKERPEKEKDMYSVLTDEEEKDLYSLLNKLISNWRETKEISIPLPPHPLKEGPHPVGHPPVPPVGPKDHPEGKRPLPVPPIPEIGPDLKETEELKNPDIITEAQDISHEIATKDNLDSIETAEIVEETNDLIETEPLNTEDDNNISSEKETLQEESNK